jgi:hypothetical protein
MKKILVVKLLVQRHLLAFAPVVVAFLRFVQVRFIFYKFIFINLHSNSFSIKRPYLSQFEIIVWKAFFRSLAPVLILTKEVYKWIGGALWIRIPIVLVHVLFKNFSEHRYMLVNIIWWMPTEVVYIVTHSLVSWVELVNFVHTCFSIVCVKYAALIVTV